MSSPSVSKALVVIVDDDDDLRESFSAILETRGYCIQDFDNAESAIAAIEKGNCSPNVVVMDGNLPGMPGRDAIAKIAALQPDLMIIAVSGEAHRRENMLAAGASAFLEKPVEIPLFLEIIADFVGS